MNDDLSIGKAGLGLIQSFEGYHTRLKDGSCRAYLDTLVRPALRSKGYKGLWTIGWGNTGVSLIDGSPITEGTVWTRKRAEEELRLMVVRHEAVVKKLVKVPLTQNQFDALVSLSYNLGLHKAQSLLRALNQGDYEKAADSFALYNKAGGRVYRGLARRRSAESALFRAEDKVPTATEASGKVAIMSRTRQWLAGLGLTATAATQFVSDVWEWVKANPESIALYALGISAVVWFVLKNLENKVGQDYEEGRYTPSGYDV